ncbi:MAG: cytochrome b, partial [Paracoccaceae bacterium]
MTDRTDPSTRYRLPARLLHWGIALLVLATIPVGFVMIQSGLEREVQNALFVFHKNVGVLLLVLVAIRAAYRWRHPPAPLPADIPDWQRRIAGLTHAALYGLLFLMPVAGYVRVRAGGFPLESLDAIGVPSLVPESEALADTAKALHYYGALAITGLIALHVGAAA